MGIYVTAVAILFSWAVVVFFLVGYNDWADVAGVVATLAGYIALTQYLGFVITTPTSGEPTVTLVSLTFSEYGLLGVLALAGGAVLGRVAGVRLRQR